MKNWCWFVLGCGLLTVGSAAGVAAEEQSASVSPPEARWTALWNDSKVVEEIQTVVKAVREEEIRRHLFYLAKDPLPFRKLNYIRPGQQKSTLHEADDYIAAELQKWGYQVEREEVQVQAYRRDLNKPKAHQYSRPAPGPTETSSPKQRATFLYHFSRVLDFLKNVLSP